MKMLCKILVAWGVLLCVVLSGPSAFAFTASHKQAANNLLDTMKINELLAQSIEAMMQLELNNNPALKPFEGTMRDFFNKYMSGESLRDQFVELYAETFSEQELVELNSFYRTPTGQKALAASPQLMAKGAALGQRRVQENITELQNMIAAEAERIKGLQQQ